MSLSLDTLGYLVLTIVSVGVGLGILSTVDSGDNEVDPVVNSIKGSDYPVCQDFEENQSVSRKGLRTILYGRYLDVCQTDKNTVKLDFELRKEFLSKVSSDLPDEPQTLYREDCDEIPGLDGFVVEDLEINNYGDFGEKITIKGTENVRVCEK